jgi:hypothetical protein
LEVPPKRELEGKTPEYLKKFKKKKTKLEGQKIKKIYEKKPEKIGIEKLTKKKNGMLDLWKNPQVLSTGARNFSQLLSWLKPPSFVVSFKTSGKNGKNLVVKLWGCDKWVLKIRGKKRKFVATFQPDFSQISYSWHKKLQNLEIQPRENQRGKPSEYLRKFKKKTT